MDFFKEFKVDVSYHDPIMRDHRVQNIAIMPGVTLIDVILRALLHCRIDLSRVSMQQLLFLKPIWTSEACNRRVKISLSGNSEEIKVEIKSQQLKGNVPAGNSWVLNSSCQLLLDTEIGSTPALNIGALDTMVSERFDLDEIYSVARGMNIIHGPFMKTEGVVRVYDGRVIAEVNLSTEGARLAKGFYFHPALLDASTLPYSILINEAHASRKDDPYIPMIVKRFNCYIRPGRKIYVELHQSPEQTLSTDIIYNNINIYNEQGLLLAAFEQLGAKRIRSSNFIEQFIHQEEEKPAKEIVKETAPVPAELNAKGSRKDAAAAYKASSEDRVLDALKDILVSVNPEIGTQPDLHAGFYDLGLDSSDLLKVVGQLESKLGTELYPTLLFEYKNLSELAEYIRKEFYDHLAPLPAEAGAIKDKDTTPAAVTQPVGSAHESDLTLYYPCWKPAETVAEDNSAALKNSQQVLFLSAQAQASVAANILQDNKGCIIVSQGQEYIENGNRITWQSGDKESASKLVNSLKGNSSSPLFLYSAGKENSEEVVYKLHTLLMQCALQELDNFRMIVLHGREAGVYQKAIYGYLRSASMEFPRAAFIKIETATGEEFDKGEVVKFLNDILPAALAGMRGMYSFRTNEQERQELKYARNENTVPVSGNFKKGGRYLISGGAGRISLTLAKYLLENYQANICLLSRREKNDEVLNLAKKAKDLGGKIIYIKADIGDKQEVFQAVRNMRNSLKGIDGIFHSAGLTKDARIAEKDIEQFSDTLVPKISGVNYLDLATKDDQLDFFMLFSSLSSVFGNMGQSDYTYANAYLNEFAVERAAKVKSGERNGTSISIAWPLWKDGGLAPDAMLIKQMQKTFGLRPLENSEGMSIIETALATGEPVVVPVAGKLKNFGQDLLLDKVQERIQKYGEGFAQQKAVVAGGPVEDIAIIGMSGRFPNAEDLAEFWQNLEAAKDCISRIPETRWNNQRFFHSKKGLDGKYYCEYGGFIEDHDKFDPLFFRISPQEAETMDPHERLFLQESWKALEDAGYSPERLTEKFNNEVGVFVGAMWNDYELIALENLMLGNPVMASSSSSSIANRVSYLLNLKGPSIPVDTMCSSSLMAIHLACQSIRRGECKAAIAGGVNLSLHPWKYIKLSRMQMLSPDGRCKAFGEGANGYVPGEGVASLVLKPLSKALKDKDQIYAVIKGSAVNHTGLTSGMTVPSPRAQAEVVRQALDEVKVPEETITYIEAHGTGTDLGDPIEVAGLKTAFRNTLSVKRAIGSVKTNIGHLEAAAGVASVIKVCLQMKNRKLVPSLHANTLNGKLRMDDSGFYVQTKSVEWKRTMLNGQEQPLRAGVSSFGAGGVNLHMILEESPVAVSSSYVQRASCILPLSAATDNSLNRYASILLNFLEIAGDKAPAPKDLEFTFKFGRQPMKSRALFVFSSVDDLVDQLKSYIQYGKSLPPLALADFPEEEIALAWLNGKRIGWSSSGLENARAVSLPAYPFEKRLCWLPVKGSLFFSNEQQAVKPESGMPNGVRQEQEVEIEADTEPYTEEEIRNVLLEILAKELKLSLEEIPLNEDFMSLGMDSVVAMRMITLLEEKFGNLPVSILMDNPTVENAVAQIRVTVRKKNAVEENIEVN